MSKKGRKEKKFSEKSYDTALANQSPVPWYQGAGDWMGGYDSGKKGGNGKGKDHKNWTPCYETHPPLKIGDYTIYGGSCAKPVVKDADLYVGFDTSMMSTDLCYPWTSGYEFLYYIQDMHAPKDPESFKSLIKYLDEQLRAGTKVHIGCIGGHGRTGTVLAALVQHMLGIEDAITYVRTNYCKKAVETKDQIKFLHKHFGIKEADPTKEGYSHVSSYGSSYTGAGSGGSYGSSTSVPCMNGHESCIWGAK